MRAKYFLGVALFTVVATTVIAQDRQRHGPVYRIDEPDALQSIMARLKAKEKSGELAKLQQQAIDRVRNSVLNPPSLDIPRTFKSQTFFYDPSVVVTTDIKTHTGQLIAAKGTKVNPLDTVQLSRQLLFFDASDAEQVNFASRYIHRQRGQVKPILTGGSYVELMKAWKSRVYYDQSGVLTYKFGITQVPAIVSQQGSLLRIDEVLP